MSTSKPGSPPGAKIQSGHPPGKRSFKYPSEDEALVRRLGSAVLASWSALPEDIRARILAEALTVWDREYQVPNLEKKLETFIKRYPARVG